MGKAMLAKQLHCAKRGVVFGVMEGCRKPCFLQTQQHQTSAVAASFAPKHDRSSRQFYFSY